MDAVGADLVGVIEDQGRAELAERGSAEALGARHLQDCFLVEIVAAKMLVGIADDRIGLQKWRDRAAGRSDGIPSVDRVGEVTGIAEVMAGRHRRGIGRGEGRKHRVRVLEIDAAIAHRRHGGRRFRADDPPAQSIGHEQDDVMRPGALRKACARRRQKQSSRQHHHNAAHLRKSPVNQNGILGF
jgi:hypothetical protein